MPNIQLQMSQGRLFVFLLPFNVRTAHTDRVREGTLHKSKTPDRALRSNALFVRFLVLVLSIAVLVLVLEVT